MAIYDTTGQVGIAKAAKQYFKEMQDIQAQKAGKASSRKMGLAGAKGIKKFQEFMGPGKLTAGGESIFQQQPPTGTLLERVGQKIAGPDLSTAQLTPKATEAGYTLGKEPHTRWGKTKEPTVLRKIAPGITSVPGGGVVEKTTGRAGMMMDGKWIGSAAKPAEKGAEVAKQFGPAGAKLGSIMGAYQVGSGLSTAFDPKASVTRKVAGAANVALGANALLALGGANAWNPMGWGAMAAGGIATLADMFG